MGKQAFRIGCVGDDFTGSGDAASFLRSQGLKTVLFNEIPEKPLEESCDAVVIALKSRTEPVKKAVGDTLRALHWLKDNGAEILYVKYCSTFDSTREGNIGPVLDAALESFELPYTVLCPALPVNGRTVHDGKLYVSGVALHETHMKNHPLTPMWDCRIPELMRQQSKYPCFLVPLSLMAQGPEAVAAQAAQYSREHKHFYLVPDYYEDSHADLIWKSFPGLKLLSGGSGLVGAGVLNRVGRDERDTANVREPGKSLLLAGSCSVATLGQIANYQASGNPSVKIDPMEVLEGKVTAKDLWEQQGGTDGILFYCSDSPENVKKMQLLGRERVAAALENTMASLARLASQDGYTQIIVAGGETSGAVTKALGHEAFWIGESVAPGVPVMMPVGEGKLRLVLKSGNFGQPDFFERAITCTKKGE